MTACLICNAWRDELLAALDRDDLDRCYTVLESYDAHRNAAHERVVA